LGVGEKFFWYRKAGDPWLCSGAVHLGVLLLALATPLDPASAPGTGATSLDYIGATIGQLQAAGYTPDGVVISGTDPNKMRLLKNSYRDYIWASPDSALGVASVWSVPVVVSPKMPAGQFLVKVRCCLSGSCSPSNSAFAPTSSPQTANISAMFMGNSPAQW
jgi:hypothetical protein